MINNMIKKTIALITMLVIVVSMCPMKVFADSPYTLVDDDVVVTDGVIMSYTYSGSGTAPKDIIIPSTLDGQAVTGIGSASFGSEGLIGVIIPDGVKSIGDRAFMEDDLISLSIPDSVTSIGIAAFSRNELTNINIPNGVTSIGMGAFFHNKLKSVTISSSVTSIGEEAFNENTALTAITLPTSTKTGHTFLNWTDSASPASTYNGGASISNFLLAYTANFQSSDTTLLDLSISEGTLTPSFASNTISYSADVANNISSIDITPTVNESHATVTVNRTGVAISVQLDVGDNVIPIEVTAQDGTTTSTYTVTVKRAEPDTTPPQIISLTPEDNSINILENSKPILKLNENIKVGTGNVKIYKTYNDQLVETIDITSGNVTGWGTDTITITPASDFEQGIDYYILVDSGCLIDESNNPFKGIATKEEWNFTTVMSLYKHDSTINKDIDYFMTMHDVAIDSDGNLYVSDSEMMEERIIKFKNTGELLTSWSVEYPRGVAIDSENNVYVVADYYNYTAEGPCVKKFTSTGGVIATIGGYGSGDGQFDGPMGIAIDSNNNIFVVDTGNFRIQKFNSEGTFIVAWGEEGSGNGQFKEPTAIATDSKDNIYVVDDFNHRIQKFSNEGTFITAWGNEGSLAGEFSRSEGIAIDSDDNVYVTDYKGYDYCRMQKFDNEGNFITLIDFDGGSQAKGIDVDKNGNIYVGEYGNMHIKKYIPIIQVTNNFGASDTVKVVELSENTVVKIYDASVGGNLIGTGTVAPGEDFVVINFLANLGNEAGGVWGTITPTGSVEDVRTRWGYGAASSAVTITESHTNVSTHGGSDGSIEVTATGGKGTYEYSKDNGTSWQDSNEFIGLSAGTYQIQARDKVDTNNVSSVTSVIITSKRKKSSKPKVVTIPAHDGDEEARVKVISESKRVGGKKIANVIVDKNSLNKFVKSVTKEQGKDVVLQVEAPGENDTIVGQLTGEMVKSMEEKDITVKIATNQASYNLPAKEINIEAVSEKLGEDIALEDIVVELEVKEPNNNDIEIVENKTNEDSLSVVVPPVEFTVKCKHEGKIVEVEKYYNYVERRILLPDNIDYGKITTAIVYDSDGRLRHIPTKVSVIDGKYYAIINSMTNSIYTVIYNEKDFEDIKGHWAEEDIKDMASRLVIKGETEDIFNPNKYIVRAEFTKLIVRALGLKAEDFETGFSDIDKSRDVHDYICTAYSYGLVKGFPGKVFKPDEPITRLEAMIIVTRLMHMAGYNMEIADTEIEEILNKYDENVPDWAKKDIATAIKYEVVKGYDKKLFFKNNVTKAESTALLRRVLKNLDLI